MNLVNTSFLGNTFVNDPNLKNWIKIDNVVLGNSSVFKYNSGNSLDIRALLTTLESDSKVIVCLYEWKTGNYYTKSGFNLSAPSDYSNNALFTAFIIKGRTNSIYVPTPGSLPVQTPDTPEFKLNWVTWNGKSFSLNGQPFVPLGANCPWIGQSGTPDCQREEMCKVIQRMKGNTIRAHSLGHGPELRDALRPAGNNSNKVDAWKSIDNCFMLAKKYNIKLVCPLLDAYNYGAGDYGEYCIRRGVPKTDFFTNMDVRADFKLYITDYINHVNPLTGYAIKDCPEILYIELGNELGEPRPTVTSTAIPTEDWLTDISDFIKTLTTHYIMCPTDETLGQSNEFNIKNLDCYSGHYYYNDYRFAGSVSKSHAVGKPYIIGEYDGKSGQDFYDRMISFGVDGLMLWNLYSHMDGTTNSPMRIWDDGYCLHYPENSDTLLIISNYFRKVQGLPTVSYL